MNEHNNCIDGRCPAGVDEIRKIGLTSTEKKAIFHSILNLASVGTKESDNSVTPESATA